MSSFIKFVTYFTIIAFLGVQSGISAPVEISQIINEEYVCEDYSSGNSFEFSMLTDSSNVSLSKAYIEDIKPSSIKTIKEKKVPLKVSAGSDQETMIGVSPSEVDQSWPWWGKAIVITVGVVIAGTLTYIVFDKLDHSNSSSSSGDNSSQNMDVNVGGSGNTVNIDYHSPSTAY